MVVGNNFFSFTDFFSEQLFRKKYASPLGAVFFTLIAAGVAYLIAKDSWTISIFIISLAIGIPVLIFSLTYMHFGVSVILGVSFFILGILRFTDLPIGTLMDALIILMLLGITWQMMLKNDWAVFSNLPGKMLLVWVFYNLVQVANPFTVSKIAWVFSFRLFIVVTLFYYVAAYVINTPKRLYTFIELLVFLCFLMGAYGLFQEFHGLLPFEEEWIRSDDQRLGLFYNWGKFRKCSFFTSPTIFGITAAFGSVLCIILSLDKVSFGRKIYLWAASLVLLLSMVFSGTRTAYAILPAAFVFFALITLKKNTLIVTALFLTAGTAIILSPINSLGPLDANNLARLRSAFIFEEDPSFNLRLKNQALIQPYIQSHPIGAGLGSVGGLGKLYAQGSAVAEFQPDSEFVKIAVESGYVGLILYCILLFVILQGSLKTYLMVTDPKLKLYLAASLVIIYSVIVASYAQEALFYPVSIILYVLMAACVNMKIPKTGLNPKPVTNE